MVRWLGGYDKYGKNLGAKLERAKLIKILISEVKQ